MGQLTIRATDELLDRVRAASAARGKSMNEFVAVVLDAATNPDSTGDERERLRERLSLAGLLSPATRSPRRRPSPAAVATARAAAGTGTPLSDLVGEERE